MTELEFMLAYVAGTVLICLALSIFSAWWMRRTEQRARMTARAEAQRRRALRIIDLSGANRPERNF